MHDYRETFQNEATKKISKFQSDIYTLIVGLNNQHKHCPIIPIPQAKALIEKVCSSHFDGFLILEGTGGYREQKKTYLEDAFSIHVLNTTEATVKDCAAALNKAFDQSSILIIKQPVSYEFYEQQS